MNGNYINRIRRDIDYRFQLRVRMKTDLLWLASDVLGYNRIDARHLQFDSNRNVSAQFGLAGVPFGPKNGGLPLFDFTDVGSIGTPLTLPSIQVQNTYAANAHLMSVVQSMMQTLLQAQV